MKIVDLLKKYGFGGVMDALTLDGDRRALQSEQLSVTNELLKKTVLLLSEALKRSMHLS